MTAIDQSGRISRRRFLERSAAALATPGVLAAVSSAELSQDSAKHDSEGHDSKEKVQSAAQADSSSMPAKIALEEHFVSSETLDASYGAGGSPDFRFQLEDIGSRRIAEMDRGGLELSILSLVGPGIQAIPDIPRAIGVARRANDHLAEHIAKYPKRFKGFAALPMQDPQAASQELTRCVKELGFCGALVNGFSQIGTVDSSVFYDLPQYRPFWATVQELDVPFYLHPRSPLSTHQPAYEGHPWLTGSIWGFTADASIHALRLMGSGLFDEFPKLKIILGHLGEGLPCSIWRIDNRISRTLGARPKAKLPIGHYLREISTSPPAVISARRR